MSVTSPKTLQLIMGLHEIVDQYDAFILDIFGVIHDGIHPFPGTVDCLHMLKNAGKQTCLLSNSPRRADGATSQMEMMGIPRTLYDHAITSGEATYLSLKNRDESLGDDCWFIGTDIVHETIEGLGLNLVNGPEDARFILNAIPSIDADAVEHFKSQLQYAVDQQLPMICANPDLVVNIGDEQYECAGTFAAYYENLGGRVVYHGKPHAPVYEMALGLLGVADRSKICAIGDSLHTDISGAHNFGIDSVLNLVGIHQQDILSNGRIDPEKMRDMLSLASKHPTYMMAGFNW